ncbi:DnaJ domain-containing protein [Acaryochloris sp. CCMEE 5410]|uniref:J domain-containing protein n=1 Tax=Acaryochloris sp. CCMEE 5410 TaxID=310037 RepID=UPI0002485325|nr:DnaJ domain-containing protein [Acaryochloris sp. CCMEE 5410]KAI9133766.1 DnaJ domain-containing protein [Acaryochloris sp. CCMEE 5410]
MSFEMKHGLAIFDCPDHYASLGLSIGASKGEIRKRYFKIARSLHPDSCPDGMDKAEASRMLSKLVNPAYEVLSQDKDFEEYKVLLRLVGQRANREVNPSSMQTPEAQELLTTSSFEERYQEQVQQLAQNQFENLDGILAVVSRLSELNLAYLIRREGTQKPGARAAQPMQARAAQAQPEAAAKPETSVSPSPAEQSPPQEAATSQFVNDYCRRAEELIQKNRLNDAIVELRDALKLEPKNSRCHTLMGSIYLQKKSLKMAKVHFTQALNSDPQNAEAIKGKQKLEKLEKKAQPAAAKQTQAKQPERKKGLFGLFGGKK